ncbi:VanZ family protein [Singulisphaera rosea]
MSRRVRLAVAWTCVILALCLIPARFLPPEEFPDRVSHFDKIVHASLFGIFGLLWIRASRTSKLTAGVLVGGLALAAVTELGQALPIVSRDADLLDFLADLFGLVVGVAWARWRGAGAEVAKPDSTPVGV